MFSILGYRHSPPRSRSNSATEFSSFLLGGGGAGDGELADNQQHQVQRTKEGGKDTSTTVFGRRAAAQRPPPQHVRRYSAGDLEQEVDFSLLRDELLLLDSPDATATRPHANSNPPPPSRSLFQYQEQGQEGDFEAGVRWKGDYGNSGYQNNGGDEYFDDENDDEDEEEYDRLSTSSYDYDEEGDDDLRWG